MREELLSIVDRFSNPTIAVVGDLIADQFVYGQIARVSREAPVLVLEHRELVQVPGGGANAANNLLALGCKVRIVAVVGRDPAGKLLLSTLKRKGADTGHVVSTPDYVTPVKTRILAGLHHASPQQIVRVDHVPGRGSSPHRQWAKIAGVFDRCHGVILSDYGYGAVTPELARNLSHRLRPAGVPLVVDSRFDMDRFHGVTSITPNITELEATIGESIGKDPVRLSRAARRVLRRQQLDSLLVTQGRYGMTLFEPGKSPVRIPVFGRDEVADVTGAGDTVIAVFTLALACGATFEQAARLANYAGGAVVMKRGTAVVSAAELRAAILSETDAPSGIR